MEKTSRHEKNIGPGFEFTGFIFGCNTLRWSISVL